MSSISEIIINSRITNTKVNIPDKKKKNIRISEGYKIQNTVFEFFQKNNAYTGWKIGCTTPVMQEYLNINSPCLGRVMKKNIYSKTNSVDFDHFIHPGVECEIAVKLSENFSYKKKIKDLNDIVEKIVPSIEIVDDRWSDYSKESTAILIADDFFASSLVIGEGRKNLALEDLKNLSGHMKVNGVKIGEGTGKDILEDPINALKWFLSFDFGKTNHPKARDIISLGSLVQTYWVKKEDFVEIEIEKIGNTEIKFR